MIHRQLNQKHAFLYKMETELNLTDFKLIQRALKIARQHDKQIEAKFNKINKVLKKYKEDKQQKTAIKKKVLNSYSLKELKDIVREENINITQNKECLINDMANRPHIYGNLFYHKPKKVKIELKVREKSTKSYTRQDLENEGKVIPFLTLQPKYRRLYIGLSYNKRENLKGLWSKQKYTKNELEKILDNMSTEKEEAIIPKQKPQFLEDLLQGIKN